MVEEKGAAAAQGRAAAEKLARQRAGLLEAALRHVPFDGWTWTAIDAGARDLALAPGEAHRLFPGGPGELIRAFSAAADRRMLESLEGLDLASMKVREKIAAGVRARLDVRHALPVLAKRLVVCFSRGGR